MKAFVHEGEKGLAGSFYREMEEITPKRGQVRVKLKYAGLNHRDLFVMERHQSIEPPLILGSDGAGIIEAIGEGITEFRIGDEVIINPSIGWINKSEAPPSGFQVLGLPDHGTFAEKITISGDNVELKPSYLTWEEAAVFSLAGLTAYRALFTRAKIKSTDTILLPGVGGGVVTLLLLFAKAFGARVIVTSRSKEKRKKALELGADRAIDSSSDWKEQLEGEKIDVVIESVGAATLPKSLDQLRPGGTLVTFGSSTGDEIAINIRHFFYSQLNLLGTTMGSREEYREMLSFANKHRIKPILDRVFLLNETKEALKRLENAEQFGKIALKISE